MKGHTKQRRTWRKIWRRIKEEIIETLIVVVLPTFFIFGMFFIGCVSDMNGSFRFLDYAHNPHCDKENLFVGQFQVYSFAG